MLQCRHGSVCAEIGFHGKVQCSEAWGRTLASSRYHLRVQYSTFTVPISSSVGQKQRQCIDWVWASILLTSGREDLGQTAATGSLENTSSEKHPRIIRDHFPFFASLVAHILMIAWADLSGHICDHHICDMIWTEHRYSIAR